MNKINHVNPHLNSCVKFQRTDVVFKLNLIKSEYQNFHKSEY